MKFETVYMIYIFTFHGVLNHGATLQAYALQKYIISLGLDAKVVNYRPPYFLWQVYRPSKSLSRTVLKLVRLFKFRNFRRKYFYETKWIFSSSGIRPLMQYGDICITGSDQIWNKNLTNGKHDLNFFLNFQCEGVVKAAYAASAGGSKISTSDVDAIACIQRYDFIGVREESLRLNLAEIGINEVVETVVDPTLLLSNYEELISNNVGERLKLPHKYIATYEVSTDQTRKHFEDKVKELQRKTGLPVVHVGDKKLNCAEINKLAISPEEWLSIINGSYLVCTNSYHGMLMSINLRKPFFLFPHVEDEKNVRLFNVLEKCAMYDEFKSSLSTMTPIKNNSRSELDVWVATSKIFLNSILGAS